MKLKIKLITSLAFLIFTFFSPLIVSAQTNDVTAYLFHGEGCPHCAQEIEFIENELIPQYPNLQVLSYEIYHSRDNTRFLKEAAKILDVNVSGVPFLVIGNETFIGYSDGITNENIKEKVEECSIEKCSDPLATLASSYQSDSQRNNEFEEVSDSENKKQTEENKENKEDKTISLPIFGNINQNDFSLPVLTILIGIIDGFNPCAMWVLLFLISLLLGMKDRRRMWILGISFIITSSAVYFIFMAAWLNLIIFLGFIIWVRIIIGLVSLIGGAFNLKKYFTMKDSGCEVSSAKKKKKTIDRMKKVVQEKSFFLALIGIITLAFAVNLVELVCSAGLPAIYTQILALNDFSTLKHYSYILLYIIFFMLDDIIIFAIAMTTLKATGISTKYSKLSKLIGGILMVLIGLLLIFKPQWLLFG